MGLSFKRLMNTQSVQKMEETQGEPESTLPESILYWLEEIPCSMEFCQRYGTIGRPITLEPLPEEFRIKLKMQLVEAYPQPLDLDSCCEEFGYEKDDTAHKYRALRIHQQAAEDGFQPLSKFQGWPLEYNAVTADRVDAAATKQRLRQILKDLKVYETKISKELQQSKYNQLQNDERIGRFITPMFYSLLNEYHAFINEFPPKQPRVHHKFIQDDESNRQSESMSRHSSAIKSDSDDMLHDAAATTTTTTNTLPELPLEEQTRNTFHNVIKQVQYWVNLAMNRITAARTDRNVIIRPLKHSNSHISPKPVTVITHDLSYCAHQDVQLIQHQFEKTTHLLEVKAISASIQQENGQKSAKRQKLN
eukprot:GHVL01034173.1.p1 GENE.GHVL01034173.1~~GHVL01034173.1.p1  ORF type:complete len:363 (+),score=55.89 GHVL01034173.1:107-1195(+)